MEMINLRSRQETRLSTIMPEKKWTSSVVWEPSILHLRKESKNMEPKRLYRSRENRVLCGVCGGIAEYFNVDPVLIRLGMVLFICASVGTGLLAYFIASVIMPDQK